MTMKFLNAVRDAELNAIETQIGTSAVLRIYTGSGPASVADAAAGTLLVEIQTPGDWMGASSGGVKAKAGTWSGSATGSGVAGHFRILESTKTTAQIQGSVSLTGSGGDMTLDNTNIAVDQVVTVTTFQWTCGNPQT